MVSLPPRINDQLRVVLDNLALCERVCEFLQEREDGPIPTKVWMHGPQRDVEIPGANCGFVTTPVIHRAILDIRRILSFLGIGYSSKKGEFQTMPAPMWEDDYWIGDLELDPVTIEDFDALAQRSCGVSVSEALKEILAYSNKQMAHFSKNEMSENQILESLRLVCRVMIDALMVFVYDAIGQARPRLGLVEAA